MSISREEFSRQMYIADSLTDEQATRCKELGCKNITPKNPRLPEGHCEWVGSARELIRLLDNREFCVMKPPLGCPKNLFTEIGTSS